MGVANIINFLSILTILAQITSGIILLSIIFKKPLEKINRFFTKNSLKLSFLVAASATLGSLYFSEIAHFTPCILCWYQRILMYPQAIILGLAAFKKDKSIAVYSLVLSSFGALIALYHYLLQIKALHEVVPCAKTVVAVDCSQKVFMHFGYITIPMMALSIFVLIILLQVLNLRKK